LIVHQRILSGRVGRGFLMRPALPYYNVQR
jgi:hypothetical protein